jgi:magnesium transporter
LSLSCVSKRDVLQVVVPTQFVLFNLSAITGSAILYGDFRTAKFHQFVTFIYGCTATFAGVWIIAWVPASEEPSAGLDNRVGATNDVEVHDVFVPDGVSVGAVGRKPVLRSRQSTVSLVGISPAQVQSSTYLFKEPLTLIRFTAPTIGTHATSA